MTFRSDRGVPSAVSGRHACAGIASKGPYTPTLVSTLDDLEDTFGIGMGVKGAAYVMGQLDTPVLFRRLPAFAVAADIGDPVLDEWDGANPPALSGTPNDYYEVIFEVVLAGALNTATGRYSLDGGTTYSTTAVIPTNGIVVLTGSGITVTFTGNVDGSFSFSAYPAASNVGPVTATRVDGSTSVVTVTGTCVDAYEAVLEILDGGTRGTAGITYRISLDGGRSYTKKLRLGTDVTIQINDGTIDSGLDFALAAGDLDAGDVFTFETTEPAIQASDVVEALEELDDEETDWDFCHVVGAVDATAAGTIGGTFTTFAADALGNARFSHAWMSTRSEYARESESTFESRMIEDFDAHENARTFISSGYTRFTCPITRRRNRRPVSWLAVVEDLRLPLQEELSRFARGPLSSDVTIYESGVRLEHDARIRQALQAERFVTLRTRKRRAGVYFTRGSSFDAEGGLEGLRPRRRVLDVAAYIYRDVLEDQLGDETEVNAADEDNPGCLPEEVAARIDRDVISAIEARLGGKYSTITVRVSRTTVLGPGVRLPARMSIVGLEYFDGFDAEIGYVRANRAAAA
jgi:hypothetical protein